jgi:hypothetical protein
MLESGGYVETGFTNVGMPGARKRAVSFGIRTAALDATTVGAPVVKYRLYEESSWTTLTGPMAEDGTAYVYPASGPVYDDTFFYWFDANFESVLFDEIELRIETVKSVIVKYAALYFMKILSGNFAWNAALDLTNTVEVQTDEAQATALNALITSGRIVSMIYRDTAYKVRVSAWNGTDSTGRADNRSSRTISLIQIRDRP